MSIVDHQKAEEIPWRPNYRVWSVAGIDQGVDCTLHYSTVEPGAGAPLHIHEVDELITVLEGQVGGTHRRRQGHRLGQPDNGDSEGRCPRASPHPAKGPP